VPFLGAPGALAHYFRIPLLSLHTPYFFRRFDFFSQSQIYQSPRRNILTTSAFHHTHTHFLYFFENFFQKFLGPFLGPPGLLPSIFEFPFSRYVSPYFFRRFDFISHFLLHGSAKGLKYRVQSPCCGEAGPIYTFSKFFFQKMFWALFPHPGGFCPPFSNSPSHAPYPHIFPNFRPFLHFLLQGIHLLMIGTHLLLTGVTNLRPVALTWPAFFTTTSTPPPPSPLHHEVVEPNLHSHPYALHLLQGLVNIFFRSKVQDSMKGQAYYYSVLKHCAANRKRLFQRCQP